MPVPVWRAALLLFHSGACALVYQVVWQREFRLVFGATTAASAAVLAIFVAGLGAGSLVLGPRADRHPRPLRMYGSLEGLIALSAAASPLLLMAVRSLYVSAGGTPVLGLWGGTLLRLVLATLVLALPTFLMGGTLPAAARAVTSPDDSRRVDVAALYALNTLGAVVGSALATFFLIETYGSRLTLWLACLVNLLVAAAARASAPPLAVTPDPARNFETTSSLDAGGTLQAASGDSVDAASGRFSASAPAPRRFVLAGAGVVGFAILPDGAGLP